MGKRREELPHHPLPEGLEAHLKTSLLDESFGFLSTLAASDKVRNQITAEMLKNLGIHIQPFSEDSHGTDAILIRPGDSGIFVIETAELKSCYVPSPGRKANVFEYGWLSADVCARLAGEVHVLSRFRRCEDGLDRIVDCHILDKGSMFHDLLSRRSIEIQAGRPVERVRYSLNQMVEMGALRII